MFYGNSSLEVAAATRPGIRGNASYFKCDTSTSTMCARRAGSVVFMQSARPGRTHRNTIKFNAATDHRGQAEKLR